MKWIEYRIEYTGAFYPGGIVVQGPESEVVGFRCRNINTGYAKALQHALKPVGGEQREIGKIEFWQVV
jgi:hypothetical protein